MSLNFGYITPEKSGVEFTGGTLKKDLNLDGNNITNLPHPTDDKHAVRKKYADDELAKKLDLGGGTMTGPLSLGDNRLWNVADPTLATNGSNKRFVDNKVAVSQNLAVLKAGSTMSGNLNMDDNNITSLGTPTLSNHATNKSYVDTQTALLVLKAGDAMSGNLDMNDNKVVDLASPTGNKDAATKGYVDNKFNTALKESNYFGFEFPNTPNNTFTRSKSHTGFIFFTNDRDIKITFFAHVFDDDNSLSNLNLYYKIVYWTKAKVQKTVSTIFKTNVNEELTITGSFLQTFLIVIDDIHIF